MPSLVLMFDDSKRLKGYINDWKFKGVQRGLKWSIEVHKGPMVHRSSMRPIKVYTCPQRFNWFQRGPMRSVLAKEVKIGSMSGLKRSFDEMFLVLRGL